MSAPNNTAKHLAPGGLDGLEKIEPDLAFPPEEYKDRLARLRALMAAEKIDLLWITTPEAVTWLHGMVASWYRANSPMRYPQLYGVAVHVDSDSFIHFDHPFEATIIAKTSVSKDNRYFASREADDNLAFIKNELAAKGWLKGRVGMEFWSYVPNPAVSRMFEALFTGAGATVADASALVRRARRVKSAREIAVIERATRIAEAGHARLKNYTRPGITELDLYGEVVNAMAKEGGETPALIPVFNATPLHNERPVLTGHTMAGRKVIKAGEVLKADLCGVFHRYHANVERCYTIGEPPRSLKDRYKRAAGAFDVIRTEIKGGMTVAEVIKPLRRYYEEVGLWDEPGWGLGYELGISLPPDWVGEFYWNVRDTKYLDRVIETGMVTNFESNFDTGIIDTLVYEKTGTRILSTVPLDLIVV